VTGKRSYIPEDPSMLADGKKSGESNWEGKIPRKGNMATVNVLFGRVVVGEVTW
jgi:hypothetical protein